MATVLITWCGIEFQRKGTCNHCGECCIGCVHYNPLSNTEIGCCSVWATLDDVCKECSDLRNREIRHSNCRPYPDHPLLHLNRSKTCGFSFTRTDHGSMDDLPGIELGDTYDKSGG